MPRLEDKMWNVFYSTPSGVMDTYTVLALYQSEAEAKGRALCNRDGNTFVKAEPAFKTNL